MVNQSVETTRIEEAPELNLNSSKHTWTRLNVSGDLRSTRCSGYGDQVLMSELPGPGSDSNLDEYLNRHLLADLKSDG